MCMHILNNRRCIYGDFCTFAHSSEELEVWNRPRHVVPYHHPPQPAQVGMRFHHAVPLQAQPVSANDTSVPIPSVMDHQKPNIFAAASGLDDFEEGVEELTETHDFADDLRARIIEEHNRKQEIGGFEKSHNDASVEEITGQPLSLAWSQPDNLQWTFEVSTTAAKILHSVILFDTLATDFTILGAWLVLYGGQQRPLSGTSSLQGSGLLLKQRIAPPDKVHIKVSLKPRSGILGQLVIFDFGSFFLARGLMVHVFNEVERNLVVNMGGRKRFRPAKPDLYWEQHYTPFTMPGHEQDEVFDKALPEYPLPEQIEKLIEQGKYNNVENRVTKENYKRRMHNLLYLEEYQQRVDMSRYDLYDIEISPENSYSTPLGGVQYAADGFYYITVSVEEVLYEGGRSIRPGDLALLLPTNQQVIHECSVESVGRDTVMLKITEKAKQAATASRNRCALRFVLSRTHMRGMHYAVDHLDLNVVFPVARSSDVNDPPPSSISKCLSELKNTKLYQTQQNAINSMLDPACRQIPSLVLGPFGCGKTRTLRDCIMLLSSLVEDTTILICTHSNSAANIYVQELHREYNKRGIERVSMLRIYYTGRRTATIPEIVKLYCKMENGQLVLPSIAELKQYRIVVVTLNTSRALSLMGLPKGHFSHIFIDEAAQALESETLIPLVLANENTKVVLAGDHMQMDPPCYSEIARRYNLHVSLLERLYDHDAYNRGVGQLCKTLLTENHRSHQHILALPSKLFYKDKLTCRAEFPNTGPKDIPALKFVGVDGQEAQDDDSPSYYNVHEGLQIVEQVKLLVQGGLNQDEICVLSYYQKQVARIRQLLRNEKLRQVSVFRVDDVQGKEFRALLLSTVRTCSTIEKNLEEDAGFLTNPKLFNTAVTRAKEWLIVCGEPITLCTVGSNRICWLELIKKAHYELGSFEYQNAAQFERCLETKLIARQILDKRHEEFFRKMKQMLNPPAGVSQPPPVSMTTQEIPTTVAQNPQHLSFLQAPPHLQQQMMRSKVTELSHGSDQATISKITEELTKLSLQEQGALLSRPDLLNQRVHELENILGRAGPTAALLSATPGPSPVMGQGTQLNSAMAPSQGGVYSMGTLGSQKAVGAIAPDLPPFLTSIIDQLTTYLKWCDVHLQNPQNNRPGVKENLQKQRRNLEQQMKLVNDQIQLYRELLKIIRTSQTAVPSTTVPTTAMPAQGPPSGPVRMGPQQIPPQQIPQQQQHLPGAPGGMQQFVSRPPQQFPSGLPPMSAAVHHQQQMAQQQHIQHLQQQQLHLHQHHLQQQMYQKQMAGMGPQMQVPPITNAVGMTPSITPGASNFGGPRVTAFQPRNVQNPEVPRYSAPPSGNISSGPPAHPPQGQQLNPGHTHSGPTPQSSQSVRMPPHSHSSSAFAFGVAPYFPNAQPDEPLTQLSVQTNLGSKPLGKGLSPLAAAINDASSRSSPLHFPDTNDVYLSDDEFNS